MAKFPTVRTPTVEEVLDIADGYGLTLTVEDAESFRGLMEGTIASYHRLDDLAEPKLPVKYPRSTGYRPPPEENPYNAWYWKAEVKGKSNGPLKGKRVVLKDNICLAGVPMMNGATVLEGYVPDIDATVVTRILDAGGTIIGKAANTNLCVDGGSATTATGMVENPHKKGYTSGGSSAGSGVLVSIGEADMALGGDQGGSIRMPSCWCGIYGHKPTHGLVPYTGIFPIEMTLDHTGPMARTVSDVASLLQVIAGPDGQDPRQIGTKTQRYVSAVDKGAEGMKIGVVTEGFGHPESEEPVDSKVRAATERFKELGATVDEVSIPMHLDGPHIWNGVAVEGATAQMVKGNGFGNNWEGYYTTSLLDAYARGWHTRPDDLSETVEARHAARRVHAAQLPRPLLRQGAEPEPQAARGLRRGAGGVRRAGDADAANAGDQAAGAGLLARGECRSRAEHAGQHLPVRLHGPPGHDGALRHGGRFADRPDADRQALRRCDRHPGGRRLRDSRRLEVDVAGLCGRKLGGRRRFGGAPFIRCACPSVDAAGDAPVGGAGLVAGIAAHTGILERAADYCCPRAPPSWAIHGGLPVFDPTQDAIAHTVDVPVSELLVQQVRDPAAAPSRYGR